MKDTKKIDEMYLMIINISITIFGALLFISIGGIFSKVGGVAMAVAGIFYTMVEKRHYIRKIKT